MLLNLTKYKLNLYHYFFSKYMKAQIRTLISDPPLLDSMQFAMVFAILILPPLIMTKLWLSRYFLKNSLNNCCFFIASDISGIQNRHI